MYTVVNGFDYTNQVPFDTIKYDQAVSDPQPKANFDVLDIGSLLSFDFGQEVILWDENAPPEFTISLRKIPATPAHNCVQLASVSGSSGGAWATGGGISAIISGFPGLSIVYTFSNTTYSGGNNTAYITAITPPGYIHPGQQYMFSGYSTIATPLTNAQAYIQMQFQDGGGNLLGSPVTTLFSSTASNGSQRLSISATAPAGAAYCQVWLGAQATVSGTNSGTVSWGVPQLEPMYFTAQGITYPTADCNNFQADCSLMPDGTCSRTVRLFSGYIDDIELDYDGPNRTWHISCAGPGALLESGQINGVFTGQTDAAILTSVVNTYFSTQIAINAPNIVTPAPLVTGATLSSVSYVDNTFREVLNGLVDESGFVFFIDPYYRLNYTPAFYNAATFTLTDGTPDTISSFSFYDYKWKKDGTQVKKRIKIIGGQFRGTRQDTFSGDGTTKQFTLTFIPDVVSGITVTGTQQRVGVYGRDSLGGSIDVLLNKQSQYVLFNTAPPNSANNTVVSYAYVAPIVTQTQIQAGSAATPAYVLPNFDAKINDTNITDLTTATLRGLAEIVKWGLPRVILTLKSQKFSPAGYVIYVTSSLDGITSQPFTIQTVKASYLGGGINEYEYGLGAYNPTLIDHIRNANKAMNRSIQVANATAIQQVDVVALESIGWMDSISTSLASSFTVGTYGNAGSKYGACSYGGSTGLYGSTAKYNVSTIYG